VVSRIGFADRGPNAASAILFDNADTDASLEALLRLT
jgi:hypothetical protein